MAYDPRTEDYQRLGLRFARTLSGQDPFGAARAMMGFSRRFQQNRDALPQSDEDRAFHLVAEATEIIDYDLPFAPEEDIERMLREAGHLLEEAYDLDPHCHDARRMLEVLSQPGFDEYYDYLAAHADEVRQDCERQAEEVGGSRTTDEDQLAADLALRPWVRWRAQQASRALICGRYKLAARLAEELLEQNPLDPADARFTAALAYAKLEDEAALDSLARRCAVLSAHRGGEDPWMQLSRVALAHKRRAWRDAERTVRSLVATYPHAGITLCRQDELPDGVFGRLAVGPRSEDELILTVSEGTVLLQEGCTPDSRGPFGDWLAHCAPVREAVLRDQSHTPEDERIVGGAPAGEGPADGERPADDAGGEGASE